MLVFTFDARSGKVALKQHAACDAATGFRTAALRIPPSGECLSP